MLKNTRMSYLQMQRRDKAKVKDKYYMTICANLSSCASVDIQTKTSDDDFSRCTYSPADDGQPTHPRSIIVIGSNFEVVIQTRRKRRTGEGAEGVKSKSR